MNKFAFSAVLGLGLFMIFGAYAYGPNYVGMGATQVSHPLDSHFYDHTISPMEKLYDTASDKKPARR